MREIGKLGKNLRDSKGICKNLKEFEGTCENLRQSRRINLVRKIWKNLEECAGI